VSDAAQAPCQATALPAWRPGPPLLGAALAAALLLIAWLCGSNDALPFLPHDDAAPWIVYPLPPQRTARAAAALPCTFRGEITLAAPPRRATLRLAAFRSAEVSINQQPAGHTETDAGWKQPTTLDVTPLLRAGSNQLSVRVSNGQGPPALQLSLELDDRTIVAGPDWEASFAGAAWRPARLADERPALAPEGDDPTPAAALRDLGPRLALGALAIAGAALLVARLARRRASSPRDEGRGAGGLTRPQAALAFALVAAAWAALFWHDLPHLPLLTGFDVSDHLDYVRYLQEHRALPSASEGWQMYQPPLYYLLAAGALEFFGRTADADGLVVLRALGLLLGLAQLACLFASLRLLLPRRARAQLAGLLLAACLPAQLSLYQCVTNEALLATCASATLAVCLGLLVRRNASVWRQLALGGCLGAALLAKVSALVLLPAVALVLAARLFVLGRQPLRAWLKDFALPLAVGLLTSAWHYVRLAREFGNPLITNWDPALGDAWWQDPGYRTAGDFLAFGDVFHAPFFAGFHGLLDGLYSTLWGDGLWSGMPDATFRPVWDYALMSAGYLLALVPCALVVCGTLVAATRWLRRPGVAGLLVGSLTAGLLASLVLVFLQCASYAMSKSFYALSAAVPLCAAAGLGFERLGRRAGVSAVLWALLGTWAAVAYGAYWIDADAPELEQRAGIERLSAGQPAEALAHLERAFAADPQDGLALAAAADACASLGDEQRSWELRERALAVAPHDPRVVHAISGAVAARSGLERALELQRELVRAVPDCADAHHQLALLLSQRRDWNGVRGALREALRITPTSAPLHYLLGMAYLEEAHFDLGAQHLHHALAIAPDLQQATDALAALAAAGLDPQAAPATR